jgi:hypothetical protein
MLVNNPKSEQAVIFLHIPKTAGTTLHRIIERHYRPEHRYSVGFSEDESVTELAQLSEERRAQIRMLRGHFGFGVHRYLPGPSSYITVLRDPVERVVSYYYYIRRMPHHYLHDRITSPEVSLQEFVESKQHVMTNNAQTRFLSGVWLGPFFGDKFGETTEEMLDLAKRNLRDSFAAVGFVERFDETLLLFGNVLGWRNLYYTRQNVGSGRPRRDKLHPATLEAIVEANQLDFELYRHATHLFEEQVRQQNALFSLEVRLFRLVNRFWGRLPRRT